MVVIKLRNKPPHCSRTYCALQIENGGAYFEAAFAFALNLLIVSTCRPGTCSRSVDAPAFEFRNPYRRDFNGRNSSATASCSGAPRKEARRWPSAEAFASILRASRKQIAAARKADVHGGLSC